MTWKEKILAKLLAFALSKAGSAVRAGAGWIIAAVAATHCVPDHDLPEIQQGLVSGGMALLALLYAWVQHWFYQKRVEQHADAVTQALFTPAPGSLPRPDETIEEFQKRTGLPVRRALPADQ